MNVSMPHSSAALGHTPCLGLFSSFLLLMLVVFASVPAQAQLKLSDNGNVAVGAQDPSEAQKLSAKCNGQSGCSTGVYGEGDTYGIEGKLTNGDGNGRGAAVRGTANVGPDAYGVAGYGNAGTGVQGKGSIGVEGISTVGDGKGVRGEGTIYGVEGMSENGTGVYGESASGTGIKGQSFGPLGIGVHGDGANYGVIGSAVNPNAEAGVLGVGPVYGVRGDALSEAGTGVYGEGINGAGIRGYSEFGQGMRGTGGSTGIRGEGGVYGVYGKALGAAEPLPPPPPPPPDLPILSESRVTGTGGGRTPAAPRGEGPDGSGGGSSSVTYGGYFEGLDYGVRGRVGTDPSVVIRGNSVSAAALDAGGRFTVSSGSAVSIGVMGEAQGSGQAVIGVYGKAPERTGTQNYYAGLFDGDVQINGKVTASNLSQSSDARLKEEIVDVHGAEALALVAQLRPRRYEFRPAFQASLGLPGGEQLGFIAQEVEAVLPTLVREQGGLMGDDVFQYASLGGEARGGSYKTLDYVSLIPVLTGAIQEQQVQIEAQNAQIEQLQREREEDRTLLLQVLRANGLYVPEALTTER